jgi:hypothetical protein
MRHSTREICMRIDGQIELIRRQLLIQAMGQLAPYLLSKRRTK